VQIAWISGNVLYRGKYVKMEKIYKKEAENGETDEKGKK
jgi:hypothetical protein